LEAGGIVSEESQEDVARVSYMLNGHAYGLAMSRGLGDASAIGVTAEPLVDVFSIADLLATVRKELAGNGQEGIAGNVSYGRFIIVNRHLVLFGDCWDLYRWNQYWRT
jgi:hypothetical protein